MKVVRTRRQKPPNEDIRLDGVVKWFNLEKGYGFIVRNECEDRGIFVHISAVKASGLTALKKGKWLTFSISEGLDGRPVATNLVLLNDTKQQIAAE